MLLDALPIWAFFIGVVILIIVSIEIGHQLGTAVHKRTENEKETSVSAIAGSVLGLTAFMLAFVFGVAANRFDARKELVRDDASAVRTVWMRAGSLPDAERLEARKLIGDYLDVRLDLMKKQAAQDDISNALARSVEIQVALWNQAVERGRVDNSDITAQYLESITNLADVHANRVTLALQARLPSGLWLLLILLTGLGMMVVGYQTAIAGSKRPIARIFIATAFAIVVTLIASLDRPQGGFVSVSQQPLQDVRNWISVSSATQR